MLTRAVPDSTATDSSGAAAVRKERGAEMEGGTLIAPWSQAARSAVAISRALAKRSNGFLASAVSTTCSSAWGRPGTCWAGRGGGSLTCLIRMARGVSASKGRRRVSIS